MAKKTKLSPLKNEVRISTSDASAEDTSMKFYNNLGVSEFNDFLNVADLFDLRDGKKFINGKLKQLYPSLKSTKLAPNNLKELSKSIEFLKEPVSFLYVF